MYRILFLLLALAFLSKAYSQAPPDGRDTDREAIKIQIGRITQAFIDGDIETIYKTHSKDWSGYLSDGQTKPIWGIDAYMNFYGLPWPVPAGYKPSPQPNLHYTISNYLCNFVVPDVGVASFTLDYPHENGLGFNRLRIMDVFAKREGKWLQTASYTVTDPAWKAEQLASSAALPDPVKKGLLAFRESVWRAWFGGEVAALEKMLPEEAIAIDGGSPDFQNRSFILEGSKKFAAGGGKLTRLEFPRTEIQAYGNTFILFTTYAFDVEQNGKTTTTQGTGVETFVRRGGKFLNTGWILADGKGS
jgi:hypothetical protein